MRRFLFVSFILVLYGSISAQPGGTRFKLTIDSCTIDGIEMNAETKEFNLSVKSSPGYFLLFKKDSLEVGIKIYISKIKEDNKTITIVKHLFIKRTTGEWRNINSGEYVPIEEVGNRRTISIGTDKKTYDLFIKYDLKEAVAKDYF